jgi:hypothetical protein
VEVRPEATADRPLDGCLDQRLDADSRGDGGLVGEVPQLSIAHRASDGHDASYRSDPDDPSRNFGIEAATLFADVANDDAICRHRS